MEVTDEVSSKDANHAETLKDLDSMITETKVLLERVMNLRIQCKQCQMEMLQLANPKCIKILEKVYESSLNQEMSSGQKKQLTPGSLNLKKINQVCMMDTN